MLPLPPETEGLQEKAQAITELLGTKSPSATYVLPQEYEAGQRG